MSAAIVKVPFHEGVIMVVQDKKGEHIIIRTLCDVLTLDTNAQNQRIKRDKRLSSWACKIHAHLPTDDRTREYLTIPRNKLAAFLYGIQPAMVKDPLIRKNLIGLQDELEEAMDAYFNARMGGATAQELLDRLAQQQGHFTALQGQVVELQGQVVGSLQGQAAEADRLKNEVIRLQGLLIEQFQAKAKAQAAQTLPAPASSPSGRPAPPEEPAPPPPPQEIDGDDLVLFNLIRQHEPGSPCARPPTISIKRGRRPRPPRQGRSWP